MTKANKRRIHPGSPRRSRVNAMATASVATLRSKIEFELRERVPAPFTYRDRKVVEVVSTGIPQIDTCVGGLPRGAMTEICGPACSGRTSLLLASLAARTTDGEVCALVDARDSFDPASANAAGVALNQLLWLRCQNIDQALRATDLLIQSGGFGLVAVDLSDVPARTAHQVPLNAWFRFRRAVEDTPTILMVIGQESNAKTCASLVLRMDAQRVQWSAAAQDSAKDFKAYPFARLLRGYEVCSEVVRSRIRTATDPCFENESKKKSAETGIFKTRAMWSDFSEARNRNDCKG
jgi:recombination protein RecA